MTNPYKDIPAKPEIGKNEEEILDFWKKDQTFEASIENRKDQETFTFYDGPPFANGLPHFGHILTGYVKDAVPRYKTMRGYKVDRVFGWDCHGMPAEVHTEKELGISGHEEINNLGIDKFNDACKNSVLQYTDDWETYVNRQARWVDFKNSYRTLDLEYMESVIWIFKELYKKGLIYRGFKVLAYCTRCETPLSNTELKMDDMYESRQDPALTVKFQLLDEPDTFVWAWTTTPWTLPSNLALAVNSEIEYVKVKVNKTEYAILAKSQQENFKSELTPEVNTELNTETQPEPEIVATFKGSELVGKKYKPLFDYYAGRENAFKIFAEDFVSDDEGTGIVHLAPYGEDDLEVFVQNNIEAVESVDRSGKVKANIKEFAGLHVFDSNKPIITTLKEENKVAKHETIQHSYPNCWRCSTPLIYMPLDSWFVSVTSIKNKLLDLNEEINWIPEYLKTNTFFQWLSNARDWAISRSRYWGAPIPIWISDNEEYPRIDVYGSLDEIEADFGVRPDDLHRPYIDELTRPNPDDPTGQSNMVRVPDVLDCWFESGAMPIAQVHYPFENKELLEKTYPADFIVEYIGQTRGWFYTLHVIATAIFEKPSFLNCVSHGIVLGNDGKKASKSLRNYPDPFEMFDTYGSDSIRWSLFGSGVLNGNDVIVDERSINEAFRQAVLPLWNSYYFFTIYANAESYKAKYSLKSDNILDKYILSKLFDLNKKMTEHLDNYYITSAVKEAREFLEVLTNWYIRRSRNRFWVGDEQAFDTLYTVIIETCKLLAPILPLNVEYIYKNLTGDRSIHLQDWTDHNVYSVDEKLIGEMDLTKEVCSSALALRKTLQIRVRQPLSELIVAHPNVDLLKDYEYIIAEEVNVKTIKFDVNPQDYAKTTISPVPAKIGPKYGDKVQEIIKGIKQGDWSKSGDIVSVAGIDLDEEDYKISLQNISEDSSNEIHMLKDGNGIISLDTNLSQELLEEGKARDLVRLIQQERKDKDLNVSDKIFVIVSDIQENINAYKKFEDYIKGEVLANKIDFNAIDSDEIVININIDN